MLLTEVVLKIGGKLASLALKFLELQRRIERNEKITSLFFF